jgi:hypothetical protein
VYPKIVTEKVQVAHFENVFSDWSIFKEAVLLSNQCFPFKRVSASRTKTTKNGSSDAGQSDVEPKKCLATVEDDDLKQLLTEKDAEPPIQLYVHLKLICVKSYQMKTSRK